MKSRLQEKYRSDTVPALMKRFGWANVMAVPKLSKITVNIGLGEASQNVKLLDIAAQELGQITGQKAVITRRWEEHTSELQSHVNLVCRLPLEKKKKKNK